jgi:hypothetical protein
MKWYHNTDRRLPFFAERDMATLLMMNVKTRTVQCFNRGST